MSNPKSHQTAFFAGGSMNFIKIASSKDAADLFARKKYFLRFIRDTPRETKANFRN